MPKHIHIEITEIRRTEYEIEVPKVGIKSITKFVNELKTTMSDDDVWKLSMLLANCSFEEDPFTVQFRSPSDFGLDKSFFTRVGDFNNELGGNTLSTWQVVRLCHALNRLPKKGFEHTMRQSWGSQYHLMVYAENVGRYCCSVGIISNKDNPILCLHGNSNGPLFFNPTSYYAVVKRRN